MNALAALADPCRRGIVEMLIDGERTAGDLGAEFRISQPAVSKHLRVLREVGLVVARAEAQRRLYRLNPGPLAEADAWFSRHRNLWQVRTNPLTPIPARYPARVGTDPAASTACARRLRSFGLPVRMTAA